MDSWIPPSFCRLMKHVRCEARFLQGNQYWCEDNGFLAFITTEYAWAAVYALYKTSATFELVWHQKITAWHKGIQAIAYFRPKQYFSLGIKTCHHYFISSTSYYSMLYLLLVVYNCFILSIFMVVTFRHVSFPSEPWQVKSRTEFKTERIIRKSKTGRL